MPETTTSLTLLEKLRCQLIDQTAWRRLHKLHVPRIRRVLLGRGVRPSEVNDLVQEAFLVIFRRIREFRHNGRTGAFRAWINSIAINCWRASSRRERTCPPKLYGIAAEAAWDGLEARMSDCSGHDVRDEDLQQLLAQGRKEFPLKVWRAFELYGVAGRPAESVAAELNISARAVLTYKWRVLKRLQKIAATL